MDMAKTVAESVDGSRHPEGGAFYAVAGIMPDGTLREIGGEGRTWPSEDAYHEARGGMAGTVVRYYPPDAGTAPATHGDMDAGSLAGAVAGRARHLRSWGCSFAGIADDLNASGMVTSRGRRWSAGSVKRLLARMDSERASAG